MASFTQTILTLAAGEYAVTAAGPGGTFTISVALVEE